MAIYYRVNRYAIIFQVLTTGNLFCLSIGSQHQRAHKGTVCYVIIIDLYSLPVRVFVFSLFLYFFFNTSSRMMNDVKVFLPFVLITSRFLACGTDYRFPFEHGKKIRGQQGESVLGL